MSIDPGALIMIAVVGGIAGWLASLVMGGNLGLVGNIVVGVAGAFVAAWLLPSFFPSFGGPFVGAVIHSAIGAVIVLFVIGLIRRA